MTTETLPVERPEAPPTPPELLPAHTSEIGTLKKLQNHDTDWLGSSSGIYFVNTVRRAFSAAFSAPNSETQSLPAAEDILAGGEHEPPIEGGGINGLLHEGSSTSPKIDESLAAALGQAPQRDTAAELVMGFFKSWHPLFPFLHGPTFLADMAQLYPEKPEDMARLDICKAVTFQLVISIASLDRPDVTLPIESRIKSNIDIMRLAGVLSARHDIVAIQCLLAAQLYLVATFSLREASSLGGMLERMIFHSGVHRCPLRYASLTRDDCDIRKRIFWSAYALERHLSQSLGYPLTIQDDDIDVCLSGDKELHRALPKDLMVRPSHEIRYHLPNFIAASQITRPPKDPPGNPAEILEKKRREAILTSYVQYSRLTGRVIEVFHKSVNYRHAKREVIIQLVGDIEAWFNDLPDYLSEESDVTDDASPHSNLRPFFHVLYGQLALLINRPSLSLDPESAEFSHGLQQCIKTSRMILSHLKMHRTRKQTMFWPGLLSANWMAGLIIAFACQLGKYPAARAILDINGCLDLLSAMNTRWHTAKQCHLVLSSLLSDIQGRSLSATGYVSNKPAQAHRAESGAGGESDLPSPPAKRQRKSQTQKRNSISSADTHDSPSMADAVQNPNSRNNSSMADPPKSKHANFATSNTDSPATHHRIPSDWSDTNMPQGIMYPAPNLTSAYADPSGILFPSNDYTIPYAPSETDFGQWQNYEFSNNFNLADVFESATWENLVGSNATNHNWEFQ